MKKTNETAIYTSKGRKGLLYAVDEDVETSLDPADPLPVSAEALGFIADGGVTLGEESSGGDTITDSDGDTIRQTAGSTTRTLTFTLLQSRTKAAMSRVFHKDDIKADAQGKVTGIDDTGRNPTNTKLIMEFETDTGQIGRRTYHSTSFQKRGEEVINSQNIVSREVVYNINRDPKSGTFYQTRIADIVSGG